MKITAGSCRGMSLQCPKGELTRPTSAKVREAVMNMLSPWLDEAVFIDLFAGSGSMGMEALSRGAQGAIFVEENREALKCLKKNADLCLIRCKNADHSPEPFKIVPGDVTGALRGLSKRLKADIVWADPPYHESVNWLCGQDLGLVFDLLNPGGILAVEARSSDAGSMTMPESEAGRWELLKKKKYGESLVVIWRKN